MRILHYFLALYDPIFLAKCRGFSFPQPHGIGDDIVEFQKRALRPEAGLAEGVANGKAGVGVVVQKHVHLGHGRFRPQGAGRGLSAGGMVEIMAKPIRDQKYGSGREIGPPIFLICPICPIFHYKIIK